MVKPYVTGQDAPESRPPFVAASERRAGPELPPLPPSRRVGFAVVGLGRLSLESILPALTSCKLARLAAVMSGDKDKGVRIVRQYGAPEHAVYGYDEWDALGGNKDVDAVFIATPNGMHMDQVGQAARVGKHVLCEKPMAVSSAECEAMIAACRKAKRKLMIGYRSHFQPHNIHAMKLAADGAVGTRRYVQSEHGFPIGDPAQWRLKRALSGGGSLMDIGIYAVQALRYMAAEEPVSVTAVENTDHTDPRFSEVEDRIAWQFLYPSGLIGSGLSSYSSGHGHIRLTGDKGWIDLEPATSYGGQKMRVRTEQGEQAVDPPAGPAVNQFVGQLDHMAECVMSGRDPIVPGEEGLRDLKLMEAIYRSAREGKAVNLA